MKVWQSRQFGFVLREVNLELTRLLGRVRYKTLDGLSKAQLNKLVSELRESQSKIYSAYTQTLLEQLKEFMRADWSFEGAVKQACFGITGIAIEDLQRIHANAT
ncbi:hypothetical protein PSV3_00204 [Septimatrevirus PSV33]|uniref:Uncharacterized protein n=1 Tax=Pseudomonas phage PSV3 TaxID=3003632 RepID=A0AAE9W437_9CAUD|nr:hypothetical protein PM406_gp05 [Pseudomonas phage PSV3]WBF76906.1 hypothetical protein PSV3_00204 [Pseudomonas phage PSV3]